MLRGKGGDELVWAVMKRRAAWRLDCPFLVVVAGVLVFAPAACGAAPGPLRVSREQGRYFVEGDGSAVLLAGSHDGWELQDYAWGDSNPGVEFDWKGFLDALVARRHNTIRLWCVEHTKINDDDPDLTTPMPYRRDPAGGRANDGGPKFDLDRFDGAYFERLRRRVAEARDRGIYVIVMLYQGWSIEDKGGRVNPWPYHPFHRNNNVNGMDGDLDGDARGAELHSWQGERHPITARQRAYVRKVIDTVGDLDNVLFEIANESHAGSIAWQSRMTDYIHQYEKSKPKQHPVGITVPFGVPRKPGLNKALFDSPADWISPNSEAPGRYSYRDNPPPADGRKVVLLDTDHLFGVRGKDHRWVWKVFCRGYNPLYMDMWTVERDDPGRRSVRQALGHVVATAGRMRLGTAAPHGELASTAYCLAVPGHEYLVYAPSGGALSLDLSAASGPLAVEWIHPRSGAVTRDSQVRGGDRREFTPPFPGDAVLYVASCTLDEKEPDG